MRDDFAFKEISIFLEERGRKDYAALSYPVRYGVSSRLIFKGYRFDCDLNGRVRYIYSEDHRLWPEPFARIKRLECNNWIFYHPSTYDDIYALTGRYYLPISSTDPSTPFTMEDPFNFPWISMAITAWDELTEYASKCIRHADDGARDLLGAVARNGMDALRERSKTFFEILGGTVPVLPPETMLVDYDVIPILISDGCLYRCAFCRFKTAKTYKIRKIEDIKVQAKRLRDFYNRDIINYSSVFLGQNDALLAGDLVIDAAEIVYKELNLAGTYHDATHIFLFGDVKAFLNATNVFWRQIDSLPYSHIHINVGIESIDQETLDMIGKPIDTKDAMAAIETAAYINRTSRKIEIDLNFIFGDNLPPGHYEKMSRHLRNAHRKAPKGTVYVSPLIGERHDPRRLRRAILELKARANWPVFLYRPIGIEPAAPCKQRLLDVY
ncbi:MAG: radical SAM protein [Dissulfurimicrobium sp.]|uniref:radical SAM protein n=1 Tax=Dissulfurimicrobium TaxID=1769732 RepID=UPI003C749B1F